MLEINSKLSLKSSHFVAACVTLWVSVCELLSDLSSRWHPLTFQNAFIIISAPGYYSPGFSGSQAPMRDFFLWISRTSSLSAEAKRGLTANRADPKQYPRLHNTYYQWEKHLPASITVLSTQLNSTAKLHLFTLHFVEKEAAFRYYQTLLYYSGWRRGVLWHVINTSSTFGGQN